MEPKRWGEAHDLFIEEDQLGCDILKMFRGHIQGVYFPRTTTKGSDELLRSCLGALQSHPGAPESKSSLVFVKKSLKFAQDCLSTNVTAHIYIYTMIYHILMSRSCFEYIYICKFTICIDIVIDVDAIHIHGF